MDDAYTTQMAAAESAESSGLAELMALKEGDAFLVADHWGDLKGGADGLFAGDTRMLSRWITVRPRSCSGGRSTRRRPAMRSRSSPTIPRPQKGGRTRWSR